MSPSRYVELLPAASGRVRWAIALLCICALPAMAADTGESSSRAQAQFAQGLQLASQGDTTGAIAVFSRLTRDYPRLSEPYAQLAALYVRQGEPLKAIAPLQTAVRLDNDAGELQEQLGDLYVVLASDAYAAVPTRATARAKAALLNQVTNALPTKNANSNR